MPPYPDPNAPYDSSVDPAWLARLPGDIHLEALDEIEKIFLLGRLAGSCPRCGHGINLDIKMDAIVSVGAAAGVPADAEHWLTTGRPSEPVEMVCNCLSSHAKDKTGCGIGFRFPSEMLVPLPHQ